MGLIDNIHLWLAATKMSPRWGCTIPNTLISFLFKIESKQVKQQAVNLIR